MDLNPLIPIGEEISVDKRKIENVLPEKILVDLPKMITGKVIDYKMTDGMGIGYVLLIENNIKIWLFSNEINENIKSQYKINDNYNRKNTINKDVFLGKYKVNYDLNGNRSIKTIANPINLISWLIFTLKDIF